MWILDTYGEIVRRMLCLINALCEIKNDIRRHGGLPNVNTVYNKFANVMDADKSLKTYIQRLATTPYTDGMPTLMDVQTYELDCKMCSLLKQLNGNAKQAICLIQTILQYDKIFDSASNAPNDLKWNWNTLMNDVFNIQKWMLKLLVSLQSDTVRNGLALKKTPSIIY